MRAPRSNKKDAEPKEPKEPNAPKGAPKWLKGLARFAFVAAPAWLPFATAAAVGQPLVEFLREHTTFGLITLIPLIATLVHQYKSYTRVHPQAAKGRARPKPQAPLRNSYAIGKDTADIALFLDAPAQRLIHLVLLGAAIATPIIKPVPYTLYQQVRDNPGPNVQAILLSALGPLAYFAYLRARPGSIIKARTASVEAIWQVAKDYLRYPKRLSATPTKTELRLMSPLLAVDVTDWKSLTEVDRAFISTPTDLSVNEEKPWDEFGVNLNARQPRAEEWRVRRDPKGRGATIEPANYPTGILWDGEHDPDPLTFIFGQNLDTSETVKVTLGEASPHGAGSGGTSSGKTSGAEILAAQVLLTPMPWDNNLFGQLHAVDPKGPFARRWRGRRGVVVSEGTAEHYCEVDAETGEQLGGIEVMAMHLRAIEDERLRRDKILAKYPQAGTWIHLPDEVKKAEGFVPMLVVLDEYLDHTEKITGSSPRVGRENDARATIQELSVLNVRKGRNVGIHIWVIAQEVKMTKIGSDLMRNLPVRFVTGQMDDTQLRTMFGDRDIPSLPSTRVVDGVTKTIPGRARYMNAGGQEIQRIQIPWFGGQYNDDTLNKWLPKGEEPPNGDFTPAVGGTVHTPDADDRVLPEPGLGDADGDGEPDGVEVDPMMDLAKPADTSLGDTDDDVEDEDDEAGSRDSGAADFAPVIDLDKTFPTAQAQTPRCGEQECANDASGACADKSEPRCDEHLYPGVESDSERVCASCYWSHPIAASDLIPVLRLMRKSAAGLPGITVSWDSLDDGRVRLVAARQGGKKLVEVTGGEGVEPVARSKGGSVAGQGPVLDRVTDVFNTATGAA